MTVGSTLSENTAQTKYGNFRMWGTPKYIGFPYNCPRLLRFRWGRGALVYFDLGGVGLGPYCKVAMFHVKVENLVIRNGLYSMRGFKKGEVVGPQESRDFSFV